MTDHLGPDQRRFRLRMVFSRFSDVSENNNHDIERGNIPSVTITTDMVFPNRRQQRGMRGDAKFLNEALKSIIDVKIDLARPVDESILPDATRQLRDFFIESARMAARQLGTEELNVSFYGSDFEGPWGFVDIKDLPGNDKGAA